MTGVDPKIWGPAAWALIHSIAFNQVKTTQDLNVAKHLIYSFLYILPCDKCRRNFDRHLVSLKVPNEPDALAKWSYEMHRRISGNETWTGARHTWEGHMASWQKTMPLLLSIADTHPSMRNIDALYRDNLDVFVRSLCYFIDGAPRISKTDLSSRHMFRAWIGKIKSRFRITGINSVKSCQRDYCLSRLAI